MREGTPTRTATRELTGAIAEALARAEAAGLDAEVVFALAWARHAKARSLADARLLERVEVGGLTPALVATLGRGGEPTQDEPPQGEAPSEAVVALARVVSAVEAVRGYAPRLTAEVTLAAAMGIEGASALTGPAGADRGAVAAAIREGTRLGLLVLAVAKGGSAMGTGPVDPPTAGAADVAALRRLGDAARRHGADAMVDAAMQLATKVRSGGGSAILSELGLTGRTDEA